MKRGKLIVIEGTDGSGKETQSRLLHDRLGSYGVSSEIISFPRYGTPTGKIVGGPYLGKEEILESFFPDGASNVDSRLSSAYYAADRRAALDEMQGVLDSGKHLIADRYVWSNMAHQGAKLSEVSERKSLYSALEFLEYGFMQLPRPDLTLFLHVPYEMSEAMMQGSGRSLDGNESDSLFLKKSEEAYVELSEMYGWEKIDCVPFVNLDNPKEGISALSDVVYDGVIRFLYKS